MKNIKFASKIDQDIYQIVKGKKNQNVKNMWIYKESYKLEKKSLEVVLYQS